MLRESSRRVCEGLAAAMRATGCPRQMLTDNGKVFTGRFNQPPVEVLFDRVCRENGIEHLLTQPRSPTTTGKVERFHRALRTEFRTARVFASLAAAQAELDEWVADYNTRAPAPGAGHGHPGRTVPPADAGAGDAAAHRQRDAGRPGPRTGPTGLGGPPGQRHGVVSVNWQQVCLGAAAAGRNIDVWVTERSCSSTTASSCCAPSTAAAPGR